MRIRHLALTGAVMLAAACSPDRKEPVSPSLTPESLRPNVATFVKRMKAPPLTAGSTESDTVSIAERTTALPADIVRSAVIGRAGGSLAIPEAGLRLVVPAGAVASDVTFTVTALAGVKVAYEFGPAGSVFAVPLQVEQSTKDFAPVAGDVARAGYFGNRTDLDNDEIVGAFRESRAAKHDKLAAKITFDVGHFSGYAVAFGRQ